MNFQHIKTIAPYVFWALIAIVSYLLLMEHKGTAPSFPHMDKIIHAVLFAMLTAIGYIAYSKHPIWLYSGLLAYGVITEYLQGALTVTRYASIYDWIADTTGIALCMLVIKAIKSCTAAKATHVN